MFSFDTLKGLNEILEEIDTTRIEFQRTQQISPNEIADGLIENFGRYSAFFHALQHNIALIRAKDVIEKIHPLASKGQTQAIGLTLLHDGEIERPFQGNGIISAISHEYWEKLQSVLFLRPKFQNTLQKLKVFYLKGLDRKIEAELQKVPIAIDEAIKAEYRAMYYQNPLNFEEFLRLTNPAKPESFGGRDFSHGISGSSEEEKSGAALRKSFQDAVERKKTEQAKESQKQSFDNYEGYFNMSERDLDRAKRGSTIRRKVVKKSRRGKF